MTALIVVSVVLIVVLIAGLAFFLAWLGMLLSRIADNLEESNKHVRTVIGHAGRIRPGLEHINHSGGIVAGALPLLYGHAERIITKVTGGTPGDGVPLSGYRRSRLTEAVGFRPRG